MFGCGFHHRRHWDARFGERPEPWSEQERVERGEPAARDPELRVSQADRDEVVATLAMHYADGRLTLGEYEERVQSALEARTGSDLEPLLADLPVKRHGDGQQPGERRSSWPSPVLLAVAAVVTLAFVVGPWALWLLWPALMLTGGCRARSARGGDYRPSSTRRPAATRV